MLSGRVVTCPAVPIALATFGFANPAQSGVTQTVRCMLSETAFVTVDCAASRPTLYWVAMVLNPCDSHCEHLSGHRRHKRCCRCTPVRTGSLKVRTSLWKLRSLADCGTGAVIRVFQCTVCAQTCTCAPCGPDRSGNQSSRATSGGVKRGADRHYQGIRWHFTAACPGFTRNASSFCTRPGTWEQP